ncbi:hypothetical protein NDU88_000452 [Pleurodeles waltl]|uniref:Uncharacterized protein n=1 Tax=Pleurodeles waltl TaxID=8319 RepID=A0AAV7N9N3_PLEWA|nr:hypothetical protein NDU88_000452 [Pleurodeles waltl]
MSSLGSARKGPSLQRPLLFHGGLAWRPLRSAPAPASEDRRLQDPLSPGCRSHRRRRLEAGVGPRRPSDPVAGFRPTPLGPLGRRQIRVSDGGTGSISGPDPRPSSLQLPRAESPTRPASGVWCSPPRLRPRQDEVRALTAGAPPHSASERLGPTPTGGGISVTLRVCVSIWFVDPRGRARRAPTPPVSQLWARIASGHISGTDFFRFFGSRSNSTNRPSEGKAGMKNYTPIESRNVAQTRWPPVVRPDRAAS